MDVAEALNRMAGDKALLRSIIGIFFEQCPPLLAALDDSLRKNDPVGVRRAAHTLKGMIGNFGRKEAFDVADRLETLARGGDLSGAPPERTALESALGRLQPALTALANSLA